MKDNILRMPNKKNKKLKTITILSVIVHFPNLWHGYVVQKSSGITGFLDQGFLRGHFNVLKFWVNLFGCKALFKMHLHDAVVVVVVKKNIILFFDSILHLKPYQK